MSQHDFNIANQSFPATRTDLNNALVALASNSSGDAEPATKYANQFWYETDTNTLKIRNEANSAWIIVLQLDVELTATNTELNYNNVATLGLSEASKTVTADANTVVTLAGGISEQYAEVTSSSNAIAINLRTANNFSHTLTENTTISFANPAASGKVSAFTLKVIQASSAKSITWHSSIKWAGDTAPTLSTGNGEVDVFTGYTVDGGTNYYMFTAGQVMS